MAFKIVRNDITKVEADIIVNTANPQPKCVSGTDLAIYEAAGKEALLAERKTIGPIERGDIAVTGAYNLNAKYIIHTVGPVWIDGNHHELEILFKRTGSWHCCYFPDSRNRTWQPERNLKQ